jgi:serine/threonine protein kinase
MNLLFVNIKMENFNITQKLGEGTFSQVFEGKELSSGKYIL